MALEKTGYTKNGPYELKFMAMTGQRQTTLVRPQVETCPDQANGITSYNQQPAAVEEEATAVEIFDPRGSSLPIRNITDIDRSNSRKAAAFKDYPIVYIDDDGSSIEITGAKTAETASKANGVKKQKLRRFADARSVSTLAKLPTRTRNSCQEHKLRLRNTFDGNKYKGRVSARTAPGIPSLQNGRRSSGTQVQGGLLLTESLSLSQGDFMTDADFNRYLQKDCPSHDRVHEDDEADEEEDAGEVISDEALLDNLWKLIRAPSGAAASQSRQEPVQGRNSEIVSLGPKNVDLRPGIAVELHDGSFIRIDSMRYDSFGRATIKGYKLVRDTCCDRWLPDGRTNEVVWYNEISLDEHRAKVESVLVEVPISKVKQIRQITFTNLPYPEISFDQQVQQAALEHQSIDTSTAQEKGRLYCRWKYIQVNTKLKTNAEACLKLLDEEEAIGIGRRKASEVRKDWRHGREPIPGGSFMKPSFNLENSQRENFHRYSFGDSFCGAGGVSRGAVQAGLQLAWAFDREESSMETYKKNFAVHGAMGLTLSDADFIDLVKANPGKFEVDVAHYSPPCQAFSPANNHGNLVKDFNNQKSLFPVGDLTTLLKPRVATIEETAGLLNRHQEWFDVLVRMFTAASYSIRWGIVPCKGYGIAQSRDRLILIAAAPGEKLPPVPEVTHGDVGSGLKPWVKIRDVIYNIPPGATQQHLISRSRKPHLLTTYSDNTFAKCITTSGGQSNHHPSGSRKFSVRELASLQGFPGDHQFSGRGISIATKEIGNAVPPPLAKVIFETVIKCLKETDGVRH